MNTNELYLQKLNYIINMNRYLGIKEVGAEEMQLDKFQLMHPGRVVNPISGDKVKGYCVTYEDGYQGWSPRDVFKKAYK